MKKHFILLFMALAIGSMTIPFSCQKEEIVPKKETTYNLDFIEVYNPDDIPVEYRSGGAQFVEFEGSNTIAHIFINSYPQYGFNPVFMDSVVYDKVLPEITAEIPDERGVREEKTLFEATYYLAPPLIPLYFDRIYAKSRPVNHFSRTLTGQSWNQNFAYIEFQIGSGYIDKWDPACQKIKRNYQYRENRRLIDESMQTVIDTLPGNRDCLNIYRLRQRW